MVDVQTIGFPSGVRVSAYAGQDFTGKQFHAVQLTGDIVTLATSAEAFFGVLQNEPPLNGLAVLIQRAGSKAILGATVAQHQPLSPNGAGLLVPDLQGRAVALEAGNAGDVIDVDIGTGAGTSSGGETREVIFADSTDSANWPLSAAAAAAIAAQLGPGQVYIADVVDNVANKAVTVQVTDTGAQVSRKQADGGVTRVAEVPANPTETIDGAAMTANRVLDAQNGDQTRFEVTGALGAQYDFTVTNLPEGRSVVIRFASAQGIAIPTFSGTTSLNITEPIWSAPVIVTISQLFGGQLRTTLQEQP